ncbi:MAG: UpxY family transcription antiterminator [Bacteroidales bacterium]|jgi:transcription antitermination factor NusG|nr:UpxY family transcription antiterminator [Bacteroidales bacterium]
MAAQELGTKWFVAKTRHGQELGIRNRLQSLGVEHFVPTEARKAARGKRSAEKVLIPSMIFVRTTKEEACDLANNKGLPVRYVIDCATRTLMVIPDKEMMDFQSVLDDSRDEGGLLDEVLELGDRVRVTKGVLAGVEGYVIELHGKTYVVVSLCHTIFAKARVPRAWLERI